MSRIHRSGRTNRIPPEEANRIKQKLLGGLGFPFAKVANSLYLIQGRRVNVKLTSPRASGRYWFNIQRRADSYLWICLNPRNQRWDAYYWIPASTMISLIRHGSYRDWTWARRGREIPNFMIDTKKDMYIVGRTMISISRFRDLKVPP